MVHAHATYPHIIAAAHLAARRFDHATERADRAFHEQPRMVATMRVKAVALAHLGHLDEARAELGRIPAIDPKLTIAAYREYRLLFGTSRTLGHRLRLAGLPEM